MTTQIEINDVGTIGLIQDVKPFMLPPEAWNYAQNVRVVDDDMERWQGKAQVFGSLSSKTPDFLMYVSSAAGIFWLWAATDGSLRVWDGASHTAIGSFASAAAAKNMNGTLLGGIPIFNNGIDIPKFWALPYSVATSFANLTNWPATLRARVIRAFGPYLIALNTTLGGTNSPHRLRWSHPADPGSVPASWDITDATKDAGEIELPDVDSGIILDGLPLQGRFYVYKENAVWRLRPVGGRFIFDEDPFLETIGLLATRCAAINADGSGHCFAGQDNIWMHDGNRATPMLDGRMKRTLYAAIDPTNVQLCFMFTNARKNESWFCFPTTGSSVVNQALVINQKTGACTFVDVDFVAAASGIVEISSGFLWSTTPYTWDTDPQAWSTTSGGRRIVVVNGASQKFQMFDQGSDNDGAPITWTLRREGLSVLGKKRSGDWIVDFNSKKLVTRVWPKITGSGTVSVRVGTQEVPDGATTWGAIQSFDPTTQRYVDVTSSGRAIAIEFSGTGQHRIEGYALDLVQLGQF